MKERKLTKEEFLRQFPYRAEISKIKDLLRPAQCPVAYDGVEIFRALNTIIVKVGEEYYSR